MSKTNSTRPNMKMNMALAIAYLPTFLLFSGYNICHPSNNNAKAMPTLATKILPIPYFIIESPTGIYAFIKLSILSVWFLLIIWCHLSTLLP